MLMLLSNSLRLRKLTKLIFVSFSEQQSQARLASTRLWEPFLLQRVNVCPFSRKHQGSTSSGNRAPCHRHIAVHGSLVHGYSVLSSGHSLPGLLTPLDLPVQLGVEILLLFLLYMAQSWRGTVIMAGKSWWWWELQSGSLTSPWFSKVESRECWASTCLLFFPFVRLESQPVGWCQSHAKCAPVPVKLLWKQSHRHIPKCAS